jgi:hypothetical protein
MRPKLVQQAQSELEHAPLCLFAAPERSSSQAPRPAASSSLRRRNRELDALELGGDGRELDGRALEPAADCRELVSVVVVELEPDLELVPSSPRFVHVVSRRVRVLELVLVVVVCSLARDGGPLEHFEHARRIRAVHELRHIGDGAPLLDE